MLALASTNKQWPHITSAIKIEAHYEPTHSHFQHQITPSLSSTTPPILGSRFLHPSKIEIYF